MQASPNVKAAGKPVQNAKMPASSVTSSPPTTRIKGKKSPEDSVAQYFSWVQACVEEPFCVYKCSDLQERNAEAKIGRLVAPKSRSGKVEAPLAVLEEWRAGGARRTALVQQFMKANGDKDST